MKIKYCLFKEKKQFREIGYFDTKEEAIEKILKMTRKEIKSPTFKKRNERVGGYNTTIYGINTCKFPDYVVKSWESENVVKIGTDTCELLEREYFLIVFENETTIEEPMRRVTRGVDNKNYLIRHWVDVSDNIPNGYDYIDLKGNAINKSIDRVILQKYIR